MEATKDFIPLRKNNEPTKEEPIVIDVRGVRDVRDVIDRKRKASEDLTNNYKKGHISPDINQQQQQQQQQQNFVTYNKRKTRMCYHWEFRRCYKTKEECNYAHGVDDLNSPINSYNYIENKDKKDQELKRSDEEIDKYNLKRKEEELNTKEEDLKTREESFKTIELDIESKKEFLKKKENNLKIREEQYLKRGSFSVSKETDMSKENYIKRIKYLEELVKLKEKEIILKEEQLKHYNN